MKKILNLIDQHHDFMISAHVNPDPDALCSEVALALFLVDMGKRVLIVNEEEVPERYRFLPKMSLIRPLEEMNKNLKAQVLFVLDCGDMDRIGRVKEYLPEGIIVVNIDHHVTNERFGDINWVVEDASSTCEVIYELLKSAKVALTKTQAVHLYTGIMTDTGSFCYDNTSRRAHMISGELLDFGFSANEIYRQIYETTPLSDMKLFSQVVSEFDLFGDDQIVFINLSKKIMAQFSGQFEVRDRIFKFFRSIQEIEMIVIFTEEGPQQTRVNFRSKTKVNVAKLASFFGGGGHKRASGAMVNMPMDQARAVVLRESKKVL